MISFGIGRCWFFALFILLYARLAMAMQKEKRRQRRSELFQKSGDVEYFSHNVITTEDLL